MVETAYAETRRVAPAYVRRRNKRAGPLTCEAEERRRDLQHLRKLWRRVHDTVDATGAQKFPTISVSPFH